MKRALLLAFWLPLWAGSNWSKFDAEPPDETVTTQDGRQVPFFSQLMKDRLVVINFVFTSCTVVCPMQTAVFAKVQRDLGPRAGREVHLISISVDPVNDTPDALRRFSSRYGAQTGTGHGWTFVTGEPRAITRLLNALQGGAGERSAHSRGVVVYSGATRRWSWTQESGSATAIRALLDEGARQQP